MRITDKCAQLTKLEQSIIYIFRQQNSIPIDRTKHKDFRYYKNCNKKGYSRNIVSSQSADWYYQNCYYRYYTNCNKKVYSQNIVSSQIALNFCLDLTDYALKCTAQRRERSVWFISLNAHFLSINVVFLFINISISACLAVNLFLFSAAVLPAALKRRLLSTLVHGTQRQAPIERGSPVMMLGCWCHHVPHLYLRIQHTWQSVDNRSEHF